MWGTLPSTVVNCGRQHANTVDDVQTSSNARFLRPSPVSVRILSACRSAVCIVKDRVSYDNSCWDWPDKFSGTVSYWLKIFFWYSIFRTKNSIFSDIVYLTFSRRKTLVQTGVKYGWLSPAVCRQRTEISFFGPVCSLFWLLDVIHVKSNSETLLRLVMWNNNRFTDNLFKNW